MQLKPTPFKALFLSLSLQFSYAFAGPTGGDVISGEATIRGDGSRNVEISQSSKKAIINWQSFNVGSNESVQFNTPGANAVTLNRVVGGSASEIMGHISSNGQVWLINPNGIMFGQNAQVNVAGMLASTLNISNENFMKGNYSFSQSGDNLAKVINQGNINADGGYVAMLAPQIANTGIVSAKLGTVAMGAGTEATLTFQGNRLLSLAVPKGAAVPMYDEQGNPVAALTNTGTISANGGQVLMTAESVNTLLDQSINISGIVQADTVSDLNGSLVLTSSHQTIMNNATLSAQGLNAGETGGNIKVLGEKVALMGNTSVNASGAGGGGDIRIGYDNRDPNGPEADMTVITSDVLLKAEATQTGNGGFIETSGKILKQQGVNVSTKGSANGHNGTWLLDPWNVAITTSDTDGGNFSGGNPDVFTPTGDAVDQSYSNVNVNDITTALANSNVVITTGDSSSGTEAGDIAVQTAIVSNSTNALSLNAVGAVTFNAGVTLGGDLNITAGGDISGSSGALSVAGTTTLATTVDHDIILNSNDPNNFNEVMITSAREVYINNANNLTLGSSTVNGILDVRVTGTLTQVGTLVSNDTQSGSVHRVSLGATNQVIQNGTITTDGADILLNGDQGVIQNGSLNSGDTTVDANGVELYSYRGTVTQNGYITTSGSIVDLEAAKDVVQNTSAAIITSGDVTTIGNNIHLDGTENAFTGNLSLSSHGNPLNVSVTNAGYTSQDLTNRIIIESSLNSLALTLPNYNPGTGADISLSSFINTEVLPAVINSSTFDLSLILPNYTSGLGVGDQTNDSLIGNFIDLTQLPTADTLHNLTVKTASDITLTYNNNSLTTPLTTNQVDLETTGDNSTITVQTGHIGNAMEINGGLTLKSNNGVISVSGVDSSSQIQTPHVAISNDNGTSVIALDNLTGVDGGSFALAITENDANAMPTLSYGGGYTPLLNSFSLMAPNYNQSTFLNGFLNGFILPYVANSKNFNLSLNLPADTYEINIVNPDPAAPPGVLSYINLSTLDGSIGTLQVHSAGDINFNQQTTGTFATNSIDLETTAGNLSVNAANNNRITVNQALTLVTNASGSAISINNSGTGSVDTPTLNVSGNESSINLTNVSSNSSFALNMTEDSASTLSSVATSNIGKFDSFSLTASNFAPEDSNTALYAFLNNQILMNVAKPSAFDLTLALPSDTASLVMGASFSQPFLSFATLHNTLHNLEVTTAGSLSLTNLGNALSANQVDLNTTGPDITVSYVNAGQEMTLAATDSEANIVAARVATPILNTTTNGGSITLDNVSGANSTDFTLQMTENSNAMPHLIYGQNDDGYHPAFNAFSLTAASFNQPSGALETFVNNTILPYTATPASFNLTLNLANDTNTITLGAAGILFNTIHNVEIDSTGEIDFIAEGNNTITANTVTLNTTGVGSDITVSAGYANDSITLSTLNTTTNGGIVTVNNNSLQSLALNMTENANNTPNLVLGGTGTAPLINSFSLTAPSFNEESGPLETFVNTVLGYATSPTSFNLSVTVASDIYAITVGANTSGNYIDLTTGSLNNNIGNLILQSAGDLNFTNNGGGAITVNSVDLETTGAGAHANIAAVGSGDSIDVTSSTNGITLKATGIGGQVNTKPDGDTDQGSIYTWVLNTQTHQGGIFAQGISSVFTLNITEDADTTPNLFPQLASALTGLTVTLPNYNLGNDAANNNSLTTWSNFIFSNMAVTDGFNFGINASSDPHTIQLGYGVAGNTINLSLPNDGGFANWGNLSIHSAGGINLIANNASLTANSIDLNTTGTLSDINIWTYNDNTVTLTETSDPALNLAATGGGNITVNNSGVYNVSTATVNTTTAGGNIDLSSVTGGDTGTLSPFTLNMTDNSGWMPTLTVPAAGLQSVMYTAPNLTWNIGNSLQTLFNSILTNETTTDPGTNFNLNWTTTGLRDELNMADLDITGFATNNLNLTSRGAITLSSVTVNSDLTVDNSTGFQDITENLLDGSLNVSGNATLATGGNIVLAGNNDFENQSINLTGQNITLNDTDTIGLTLGAITSNALTVTANGVISQPYEINAADTVSFTGASIIINADLNAGTNTVNLTTTNTEIASGNSAVDFEGETVTAGDLNITTASGSVIEDFGTINSSGTLTIAANDGNHDGGNVINFATPSNQFNSVNVTTAGDVSLYGMNGYNITGIQSTGDIYAETNYAIDDTTVTTGTLEVSGTITTSKPGGTIVLDNDRTTADYGIQIDPSGSVMSTGNITLSTEKSQDGLHHNGINIAGTISSTDGQVYIYDNRNYDLAPDYLHYAANMNITGSISTLNGSVMLEDFGAGTMTIADGAMIDGGNNTALTIQSDNGSILQTGGTLQSAVTSGISVNLTADEYIYQTGGTIQSASTTYLSAGSANDANQGIYLGSTDNHLHRVRASTSASGASITLDDSSSDGLIVGNVSSTDGNIYIIEWGAVPSGAALKVTGSVAAGNGAVSMAALNGGGIVEGAGGNITAGYSTTLQATGSGNGYIDLQGDNQFSAVAATADGTNGITLHDVNGSGLTLDNIDTSNSGAAVIINTSGGMTLSGNINTSTGTTSLQTSDADIIQDSATHITTTDMILSTGTGDISLNGANQVSGTLTITGNEVSFNNIIALELGNIAANSFSSTVTDAVSQATGTSLNIATTTYINAESNDVTLNNSGNYFGGAVTLSGNNIALTQDSSDSDHPLTLTDIFALGNVTILNEGGTLTFAESDHPSITEAGNNKTIILSAAQLINNNMAANAAIDLDNTSGSTWNFYLTNLTGNTFGNNMLSGQQAIWGLAYNPEYLNTLTGNRYIFATPETLQVSPIDPPFSMTKTVGTVADLPTPTADTNYQVSNFVVANTYGNIFTQDTVDNVSIAGLNFISTGAPADAPVSDTPYSITMTGTGNTQTGYTVTYNNQELFGSLYVIAAPTPDTPSISTAADAAANNPANIMPIPNQANALNAPNMNNTTIGNGKLCSTTPTDGIPTCNSK